MSENMDIQNAITILEKSEHIAIIFPRVPSFDALATGETFMRVLREKEKDVGFLCNPNILEQYIHPYKKAFSALASSAHLSREFIISLHTARTPVSQLRYEKLEEKIDVIFSPKSAPLDASTVSFRDGKIQCDCAILIGIESVESLGESIDAPPEFFTETPLINIDNASHNTGYGEANLLDTTKATLSEITYQTLTKILRQPLNADSATILLTGIIVSTKGFTISSTNADTLLASSELMRLGGRREDALAFMQQPDSLSLIQLVGRASIRSRIDKEKNILWSFLTIEDFVKTNHTPEDIPAVLERLGKEFPNIRVKTILWQNPETQLVHVALIDEEKILDMMREEIHGEYHKSCLTLSSTFTNFREAEDIMEKIISRGISMKESATYSHDSG